MVRFWRPLPSLLGLFGALLMLCPELLMVNTEGLSDLPITDPGVKKAVIFAMEQYNKEKYDDINYYKLLRVLKAQSQVTKRDKYCLIVELGRTSCPKTPGYTYQEMQNCRPLIGRINTPTCFFKVTLGSPPEMNLAMSTCSTTAESPPSDLFCSG